MLLAEYDYDTDIAVQRAEEREIAYTEGKSLGLAEGKSLGLAEGALQTKRKTAMKLLQFGLSFEDIAQATDLSKEEVEALT